MLLSVQYDIFFSSSQAPPDRDSGFSRSLSTSSSGGTSPTYIYMLVGMTERLLSSMANKEAKEGKDGGESVSSENRHSPNMSQGRQKVRGRLSNGFS